MRRYVAFLLAVLAVVAAQIAPARAGGAAPVATGDSYTVRPGKTLTVSAPKGVLANDSDPERDKLTALLAQSTSYGKLDLRPNGSFIYTPTFGGGIDSFAYWAFDGKTVSNYVSVYIKVDSAPVAKPDQYGVVLPGPRVVSAPGVLANDSDLDFDVLTAELVRRPAFGTLVFDRAGGFTYTPTSKKARSDHFTYRASDPSGQKTVPTRVDLKITVANRAPVAVADTFATQENIPLDILAPGVLSNDTDADGDPLRAELLQPPFADDFQFFDDGSFYFQPPVDWDTDVTFVYRVTDGITFSAPVVVTLDIQAVNSPPVGEDDQYTMNAGTVLHVPAPGVLANDVDPVEFDGAHVHDHVGGPGFGDLVLNRDGSFTYTPAPGFSGVDGFSYRPADSSVGNLTFVQIEVLLED